MRRPWDESSDAAGCLLGAIEALASAYETLDEHAADELESKLYGPASGAAENKRPPSTLTEFAQRNEEFFTRRAAKHFAGEGMTTRAETVDAAVALVGEADTLIAELQDSLLPVEVGDAPLREGLAARRAIAPPPGGCLVPRQRTPA